jgi:hypothetical protein
LELGLRLNRGFRGRTIFVADAHRDDGKRFVVRADEKLAAFMELELAIRAYEESERPSWLFIGLEWDGQTSKV